MRTGKRLAERTTEIAIQFKRAPFQLFRDTPVEALETNRLVLHIQPEEGLSLRFGAKIPGPIMHMGPVEMKFNYVDYFGRTPSTGYERLIYDCMMGDATLFQRADMVEAGLERDHADSGRVEGAAAAQLSQLPRRQLGAEGGGRFAGAGRTALEEDRMKKVLVIDVGGTHVKLLATGHKTRMEFDSGPTMTGKTNGGGSEAGRGQGGMEIRRRFPWVTRARSCITSPCLEPHNLGKGWVGFNFRRAFGRPIKIINDAAMQAVGSYEGGRMLFLGLGTGLGTALIDDSVLEPMELAHLPFKKGRTYEEYVGIKGLERLGRKKWRKEVAEVIQLLKAATAAGVRGCGRGQCAPAQKTSAEHTPW